MVVALGGVGQHARAAAGAWIADVVPGDLVLTSIFPRMLDEGIDETLGALPGVVMVSPVASFDLAVDGRRVDAAAMVGADLEGDGRLHFVAGDRADALAALDEGGAVIVPAGDRRAGRARPGRHAACGRRRRVGGRPACARDRRADASRRGRRESMLVGWPDAERLGVVGADAFAVRFVQPASAVDQAALADEARALALEPVALERIQGAVGEALDRVFGLFDVLALVAVVVAALGIVNTLTMNVLERVREIGVLRAAGMTRRQVWRSVVVEAGITGLVGAICGVATGVVVGGADGRAGRRSVGRGSRRALAGGRGGVRARGHAGDAGGGLSGPAREQRVDRPRRRVRVGLRRSRGARLLTSVAPPARPPHGASMTIAIPRLDRSTAAERGITLADFLVPIRLAERISTRVRHIVLIVAGALLVALSAQVVSRPCRCRSRVRRSVSCWSAPPSGSGAAPPPCCSTLRSALSACRSSPRGARVSVRSSGPPADTSSASCRGRDRRSPRRARLGSTHRRLTGGDGHRHGSHLRDRRPVAEGRRSALPWETAVAVGMTTFLLWDAAKLAVAAGIFPVAWWLIGRRPEDR